MNRRITMSIFEDVLTNAKTGVDTVSGKAVKVIDKSKLLLASANIKAELSKKYHILGRVCYEANRTGKNYDKGIKELQDEIKDLNDQLAAVNEMLENSRQKIKCPDCGTFNKKDALYCNKCGKKLPVARPKYDDDMTEEELLIFAEETLDEDI